MVMITAWPLKFQPDVLTRRNSNSALSFSARGRDERRICCAFGDENFDEARFSLGEEFFTSSCIMSCSQSFFVNLKTCRLSWLACGRNRLIGLHQFAAVHFAFAITLALERSTFARALRWTGLPSLSVFGARGGNSPAIRASLRNKNASNGRLFSR